MSTLLIGLLGVIVSTNQPVAMSNLVEQTTGISVPISSTNDPVELEYKKLEADDDRALEEIDRWILENEEFRRQGAGIPNAELNVRIRKRLDSVRQAYDDFIARNPAHVDVRLAYASFLNDIGEEGASLVHLEKARELNPENPAIWNNLANYYGHFGGVTNAFGCYQRAIDLDPAEPVYYHNFGTTVFLFRKDAREFYRINEQQVFDKAMALYSNSMRLDPTNFVLATDIAKSYYGIRPWRTNDALQAWTNALNLATDDSERQAVQLHLARVKMQTGFFDESRAHLGTVTSPEHEKLKLLLVRNLNERESGTNASPDSAETNTFSTGTPAH